MKPTFFVKTALLALSLALFAPFASADTFAFTGTDVAGDTFSGTFTATANGGVFDVTDATGTVTRVPTALTQAIDPVATTFAGPWDENNLANSPGGFYNFDNIYYPGAGNVDGDPFDHTGILFILADGHQVNIYCTTGNTNCYFNENDGFPQFQINTPISITAVAGPVPEPGSLLLFGTGALSLAGVVRRRINA